jgi:hypothetical protein
MFEALHFVQMASIAKVFYSLLVPSFQWDLSRFYIDPGH